MKRFLTILLMTVAFAMNVSVVNAKNSTGQGGTGKEFLMAMMDNGVIKSNTDIINAKWGPNTEFTYSFYCGWSGALLFDSMNYSNYDIFIAQNNGEKSQVASANARYNYGDVAINNQMLIEIYVYTKGTSDLIGKYIFTISKQNGYNWDEFDIDYTAESGGGSTTTTAKPTFSRSGNKITITSATSGATIYYNTSNGDSDPDEPIVGSSTSGPSPVTVDIPEGGSLMIYAIAKASDLDASEANKSEKYTYKYVTATPTFSRSGNTITISSEEGATIHYGYWQYSSPGNYHNIEINQTSSGNTATVELQQHNNPTTIRAYASKNGQDDSEIVISDSYNWEQQAQKPQAPTSVVIHHPLSTTEAHEVSNLNNYVSITGAESGATIYFTTDGSDPTNPSSTRKIYDSSNATSDNNIMADINDANYTNIESVTVRAVAYKDGQYSDVTSSQQYTKGAAPTIGPDSNISGNIKIDTQTDATFVCYKKTASGTWYNARDGKPSISVQSSDMPIYALAAVLNCLLSDIVTYPEAPAAPVISIESYHSSNGGYVNFQITDATEGATIDYSVDEGTTWVTYTNPFYKYASAINGNSYTIKARATKNDETSETTQIFYKTTTPTYTINGNILTINSPSDCNEIVYKLGDGSWTRTSLSSNQVTISGLSSSSLLSFRVHKSGELFSDLVTNLAAPTISIDNYNCSGENGAYVYFKITDATENATIKYNTNGSSSYNTYNDSSKPYLFASQQSNTTDYTYTIYSMAELNGHQSVTTQKPFTKTDDPIVNLSGKTLSIEGDYNGFVYKVGDGSWTGELNQKSANLTNTPAPGTTIKVRAYKTSYLFSNEVTYTVPPTATLDNNFVKLESGVPDFEDHFQITGEADNVVHYTFKYAETDLSGNPTGEYTTIDGGTGIVTLDENGQGTISHNLTDEPVVFNSSIPLILEVYATKDGKTSATNTYTFVQSAKANPIENENSVSFEAKDGDVTVTDVDLEYYYHCFDYTQNTFVWSDVKNDITFTIDDYTAATSPISITTISKESGKLKAYVPQLKLQNFVKPDAPTITNNDGTVTISTDEKGTTDYPVYLIYTTDGTDPSYTVNNEVPVATSETNTVVVNGYTTSFTISETTTVKAYVYCKDTRKYEVPYASNLATETYSYTTLTQPDAPSITYRVLKTPQITISTSETFSGNKPVYIFYTTDGSEPTIDDNTADNPNPTGMTQKYKWSGSGKISIQFNVDDNMSTVKAMVYCADDDEYDCYYSSISQFMIKPEAPTIIIDDEGYATITTTVTDSNGNPGTIYYTTNGNNPTTSSTVYTGTPVQLEEGTTIKAIVVCNDTQKYKTSTSKITTEKYDGLWTDWELYGKGNFKDAYFYINGTTVDVYVRTNQKNPNKKQIKIKNWTNNLDPNFVFTEPGYNDYIFDWNIDDNSCAIDKKYIGIHDKMNNSKYMWFIPAKDSQVASYNECTNNGEYNPETDTYTLNYYYHHSEYTDKTNNISSSSSENIQLVSATLKMDGMWLGDMTEDESNDSAVQNSYMPANSQYTVGLVKIDSENTNLSFTGDVCRIELDDAAAVESFFENTSNFVNGDTIQRRVIAGEEDTETGNYIQFTAYEGQDNEYTTFKMLDQFNFSATDEGAYYIVVARQVPSLDENGNKIYEYTGAYQYMPVYYSPASNWDVVEGDCTYQEDVVGGLYPTQCGTSNYGVTVEKLRDSNKEIYRVKNMYGEDFTKNQTHNSYQGESPYRENVYFYISTSEEVDEDSNPITVAHLLHPEFYAQPLGVDWGYGEMMLIGLGDGVVETDDDGMHIKFKNNRVEDGEDGLDGIIYEWEDCRNNGYEYDDEDDFNWWNTNCDGVADPENEEDYQRFDLFIPVSTPTNTQPDAPTITYTEGSGKVTISTDEEGTTDYPVYLIYTTNGEEPSYTVGQDGVPTASDANTVVVTGTSTSFYITSTKTVNAKVYCGKYTTPASENAEDEFTIVAPTVATTVKMNNDATTFNTKDGVPDQINYFVIYQANNYAVDFDHYSIEYQLLQDGKLLYSPDGNSYKACTEVITSQAGNLIFFDPINSYIYDSEYKHSNAFNNDHPLTIRVQVKNKNGNNLGGCSSTTFTESSAAIPVLNAENNTITIDAQNRAGLYLYYNYYDVNVEDYVWSGQKSKDHLPLTFKDYNVESSPREIYTISWQADHLKVQTEPLSISKYTRPDAPKISYDEENSTITISTDEIKGTTTDSYVYLIYTTDGTEPVLDQHYTVGQDGVPTATDGNTVVVNGSSETISNITESKNIKALVYCPDVNRFCQFDSEISTKVCAKWMAWEPYGTGSCADGFNINKFSSGHSMTDHSLVHYDIEVRTDAYNIYHKQIKIKGWSSARANKSVNCNVNGSRANSVNVELLQDDDYKSELYDDLILDWDMENNKIRIDKSHFTGLYCVLNDVRRYLWIPEKDDNAEDNGYHPEIDAYLNNISYVFSGSTEDVPHGVPSLLYLNLKMDGLWLGDMTENGNTATQEAFMPQNSHYKIGLVKIDRKNDNLKFENDEDSDDFGKCFIELTDSSKVGTFFDCTDNFVDGTVKVRHLNDGSNYIPLETGDENETVMKMKEEFDFDAADEGAYYIAVARMVPNGDGTYSYTGAYRYMPVYFSPANNWETITYDGKRRFVEGLAYQFYQFNVSCNYYDDWNEAWNITGLGNPTWMDDIENPRYSVTVQENKNEHGLFRVKNLYHNGFMGYDEDATENPLDKDIVSYQGESPYRDVYFYIDARKEIDGEDQIIEDEETDEKYYTAKLYPSEFYAQPLGVDWEMGELMLSNLDGGKYVDGHIIFEDEGNVYEPEDIEHLIINLTGQYIYCSPGHIVKTSTFYELGNEVFSTNWDYNDEYDPEYELYDNRFQLQISTPYPLFDDTPYTTTDMNSKWPDEYEENSEDYNEKYGELAIFDEDYNDCYTNGITEGQDHVDVTYERDLKEYNNTWGTIMLPFSFKASDLKLEVNGEIYVDEEAEEGTNAFNLYRISGFSTDHQNVTFTNIGDEIVNPNTPVVFKSNQHIASLDVTDGTTIKLVIDNMDTKVDAIGASTDENTSYVTTTKDENGLYIYDDKSSWWTIANYTPVAFTTEANRKSAEATGYHVETSYELPKSYVINRDEIKQATGGIRNKQYRAFFYLYSNPNPTQPVSAKSYSVFFDDDPSITDIDSVVDSRSVRTGSYNVAGQKVNRNYRGIVIENGKKSIRLKR